LQGGQDAAEDATQADRVSDSRGAAAETQVDRVRVIDASDTAGLRDARVDGSDAALDRAGDTRDSAAARDTGGGEDGAEVGGAADTSDARDVADRRDSSADTRDAAALPDTGNQDGAAGAAEVRDASKDLFKDLSNDLSKDTTNDARKLDGTTDLPPPNSCSNPIEIPMGQPHVDLALTTTGAGHNSDLPCAQGGSDVVLSLTLLQDELVYADTLGATWNTLLFFSTTCPVAPGTRTPDGGAVSCSDDACNSNQSQAFALLGTGVYYLILSGANGESGDVTLHFQHAPVGNGPVTTLAAGSDAVGGATDGVGPTDVCEAPGPSSSYWWITCPDYLGGALAASTCTGTTFDTVLSLQIPRTDVASCIDDTDPCGTRSSMNTTIPPGAGLNVLTVGGATPSAGGVYLLTYTRP